MNRKIIEVYMVSSGSKEGMNNITNSYLKVMKGHPDQEICDIKYEFDTTYDRQCYNAMVMICEKNKHQK